MAGRGSQLATSAPAPPCYVPQVKDEANVFGVSLAQLSLKQVIKAWLKRAWDNVTKEM